MVRFSRHGESPTDFERELVDQFSADEPRHVRQLWLRIAERIGLDAVAVVMDEVGGMTNLSVPKRTTFFGDLNRIAQQQEIVRRLGNRERVPAIARELGISVFSVNRVRRKLEPAKRPACPRSRESTR